MPDHSQLPVDGAKNVTKRLRYEVFNRDGHVCRYCGGRSPDVRLTVDHVVPVALGGTNHPSNLVTACAECNTGKSSSNPDAPLVAEVTDDALRWAAAMRLAGEARRTRLAHGRDAFLDEWEGWTLGNGGTVPLPGGWQESIDLLLRSGLDVEDFRELVRVAMTTRKVRDEFRYMCGCAWTEIRSRQDLARSELTDEADGNRRDENDQRDPDTVFQFRESVGLRRVIDVATDQVARHGLPLNTALDIGMGLYVSCGVLTKWREAESAMHATYDEAAAEASESCWLDLIDANESSWSDAAIDGVAHSSGFGPGAVEVPA